MRRFRWLPEGSPFDETPFRRVFRKIDRPLPVGAEMVTAYTDGQVTLRSNRDKKSYHEASSMSGYQGVKSGDFVVHGLDILRGSIGVSESDGAVSSVCSICVPIDEADPRFFAYAMRAQAWSGVPRALAKGVREGGADFRRWETLAELPLPTPPVEAQRAIADYLDAETERIDALITKKQQLIHLLEESFAGNCRNETFGRWTSVLPMRRVLDQIKTGTTPPLDVAWMIAEDGSVDWFTPGDFTQHLDLCDSERKLHKSAIEQLVVPRFPPGSVLIVGIGATAGKVGYSPKSSAGNQQITALTANDKCVARFLAWQLWARRSELLELAPYTTLPILNNEYLKSTPVALPSLAEQSAAVAVIDRLAETTAAARTCLDLQTKLLTERRQALITAAVTGEFTVPGVA